MAMDPVSIGRESPPAAAARQSILGSFLRGRPRGTSQSHPSPPPNLVVNNDNNNSPPQRNSPSPSALDQSQQGHRRRPAAANAVSPNLAPSNSTSAAALTAANLTSGAFSNMLRRRRSAGALASTTTSQAPAVVAVARTAAGNFTNSGASHLHAPQATATNSMNPSASTNPSGQTHRIRLVPHLDSRRSLKFDPICRDVHEGDAPLRIGRFTDRSGLGMAAANALGSNKLAFKSKVVSRAHAEIWVEAGGRFFIKDTKSSSGTFLNHVRLSPAGAESRPSELRDGDMLQLGVDYQGGAEDIYKCVKIKIEMGREWQAQSNPFNANALKQLKAIAGPAVPTNSKAKKTVSSKSALPDCCICLFAVTINQALFIAPCSHAYHYKCIRPLLDQHHPAFSCPLCRTFANLEEDVEVEIENESVADASAIIASVTNLVPTDAPAPAINIQASGSRERVADRDRDAGAETEVEDGPRSLGFRSRRAPPVPNLPAHNPFRRDDAMAADSDEHAMEVDMPLPPLPEGVNVDELDSGDDERSARGTASRAASLSPGPAAARSTEFLSEGDGDASGEMEEGGSDGRASGDGIINGKRKR
ncbi:SMAD/FHA domain-containing protein [Cristinia sonorae]|uniref:SMAD/FHA domain-containing protein n=1 Tax=Cristinia sonorae TaxID=1940300 RepID=A0A8K0UTW8_9AGAR|nr:SMAD/FHA domain-containing protein [Cristinia sonorae]